MLKVISIETVAKPNKWRKKTEKIMVRIGSI